MIMKDKRIFWLLIFVGYTFLNFIGFMLSRLIIKTNLPLRIVLNIFLLSLVVAIIPCIVGYFKRKLFFIIYTSFNIIAITYLLYVVSTQNLDGWSDLISFVGFLFILIIGFVIALISELGSMVYKKYKK